MQTRLYFREQYSILVLIFLALMACGQEHEPGAEWNQWRGPDRSGTWYNGPSLDTLTAKMVHQRWEVEIGPGYNGPTVSEGRVYDGLCRRI